MKTKKVILCVDDEKIILDTLIAQLKKEFSTGYILECAESVEEAWDVIAELNEDGHELALIISDWLMPKTRGDKFLVDVHKNYPKTAKIMLTGQADPDAVENAFTNANLYAYIEKPWTVNQIVEKAKEAVLVPGFVHKALEPYCIQTA